MTLAVIFALDLTLSVTYCLLHKPHSFTLRGTGDNDANSPTNRPFSFGPVHSHNHGGFYGTVNR